VSTLTWKTCSPPGGDVGVDHGGRLCIGARHQDQRRVQHIGLEAPSGCDPVIHLVITGHPKKNPKYRRSETVRELEMSKIVKEDLSNKPMGKI